VLLLQQSVEVSRIQQQVRLHQSVEVKTITHLELNLPLLVVFRIPLLEVIRSQLGGLTLQVAIIRSQQEKETRQGAIIRSRQERVQVRPLLVVSCGLRVLQEL
jgi:hypothetical protein